MAASYTYQPLPPGKIRLLKLHSPTSATLFTSTVNDNFTALSYCWGSSIRSETISIDGQALAITTTLKSALERVSGTIWIDQICINQEDNEEKSHQVRKMGEIYRRAKTTFVDLGRDEHNLGHLIDVLGSSLFAGVSFHQPDRSRHFEVMQLVREAGYEDCDTTLARLWAFGSHPYFKRIWVVQECVMAGANRLLFLIGRHRVPWKAIQISYRIMQGVDPRLLVIPTDTRESLNLSGARRMIFFQALLSDELALSDKSLSHYLWINDMDGEMQCTDPRDRLYALHAVASDRQQLPSIDYSKTNLQVRLEHSIYLLKRSPEFLNRITCALAYQDAYLPSWCLKDVPSGGAILRADKDSSTGNFLPIVYKVHGERLNVVGYVIDTIVDTKKYEATPLKIVVESGWNLARHLQDLYSLHYKGDTQAAGKAALHSLRGLYLPLLRRLAAVILIGEDVDIWRPRANKGWEQTFLEGCYAVKATLYGMAATLKECRIVSTAKGRAGLAYKETAAADAIAIIAGVDQPVVLRSEGGSYKLLWKARIDGLMNGEVLANDHALETALHPGIWLC